MAAHPLGCAVNFWELSQVGDAPRAVMALGNASAQASADPMRQGGPRGSLLWHQLKPQGEIK